MLWTERPCGWSISVVWMGNSTLRFRVRIGAPHEGGGDVGGEALSRAAGDGVGDEHAEEIGGQLGEVAADGRSQAWPVVEREFRLPGRRGPRVRWVLCGILFVFYAGISWRFLPCERGYSSAVTCRRRLRPGTVWTMLFGGCQEATGPREWAQPTWRVCCVSPPLSFRA